MRLYVIIKKIAKCFGIMEQGQKDELTLSGNILEERQRGLDLCKPVGFEQVERNENSLGRESRLGRV